MKRTATARYRDEYVWLARDHKFSDSLRRAPASWSLRRSAAAKARCFDPGVASGALDETRSFNGLDFSNDWTFRAQRYVHVHVRRRDRRHARGLRYSRVSEFAPEVAAAFGRATDEELQYVQNPRGRDLCAVCARTGASGRISRPSSACGSMRSTTNVTAITRRSARASICATTCATSCGCTRRSGRFTQAQHVEEWRVEEAQQHPDAAQVSIHSILGLEYDLGDGGRIGLEAYSKRWTTVGAVFRQPARPVGAASGPRTRSRARRAAELRSQRTRAAGAHAHLRAVHRLGNACPGRASPTISATVATCCAAGISRCR